MLWQDAVHWAKESVKNVITTPILVDSLDRRDITWLRNDAYNAAIASGVTAYIALLLLRYVLT